LYAARLWLQYAGRAYCRHIGFEERSVYGVRIALRKAGRLLGRETKACYIPTGTKLVSICIELAAKRLIRKLESLPDVPWPDEVELRVLERPADQELCLRPGCRMEVSMVADRAGKGSSYFPSERWDPMKVLSHSRLSKSTHTISFYETSITHCTLLEALRWPESGRRTPKSMQEMTVFGPKLYTTIEVFRNHIVSGGSLGPMLYNTTMAEWEKVIVCRASESYAYNEFRIVVKVRSNHSGLCLVWLGRRSPSMQGQLDLLTGQPVAKAWKRLFAFANAKMERQRSEFCTWAFPFAEETRILESSRSLVWVHERPSYVQMANGGNGVQCWMLPCAKQQQVFIAAYTGVEEEEGETASQGALSHCIAAITQRKQLAWSWESGDDLLLHPESLLMVSCADGESYCALSSYDGIRPFFMEVPKTNSGHKTCLGGKVIGGKPCLFCLFDGHVMESFGVISGAGTARDTDEEASMMAILRRVWVPV